MGVPVLRPAQLQEDLLCSRGRIKGRVGGRMDGEGWGPAWAGWRWGSPSCAPRERTCRKVLLRSSAHVILPDQDLLTV